VGYHRLEGSAAVQGLNQLYAVSRLFVNFFQPSFKLASKTRVGSRVTKRYYPPTTPCARLLASEAIPETTKERLRAILPTLDPLRLLDDVRTMQRHVAKLAAGETPRIPATDDASLQQLLQGLATAWLNGEVRSTHQPLPKSPRTWRTREDPFAGVWSQVREWLEAEPDKTPKELFLRLQQRDPGRFRDGQLRTLERRVKEWRRPAIQRLIFPGPNLLGAGPAAAAHVSMLPTPELTR
jgi:hypothetical protein